MFWITQTGNVDAITGDWLFEMNIAWNAIIKRENPELGYEVGFLEQYPGASASLPIRSKL